MEQNKNQGREQDQQNQQERQQTGRNEELRRDEDRSSRQGLTETQEDADAITSEGRQNQGKQKPVREWDTQKPAEELEGGERFPKTDQPNNRPNNDGGNRQGNQQR